MHRGVRWPIDHVWLSPWLVICRKIEDLQFQIEEEAITKEDLNVSVDQRSTTLV